MFSGGLDSAYLLWYYLEQTKYNIHAHHVVLHDRQNRGDEELAAVENIYKYFSSYREEGRLTSTQSLIECMDIEYNVWESDLYFPIAVRVSASLPAPHKVFFGWSGNTAARLSIIERFDSGMYATLWAAHRQAIVEKYRPRVPTMAEFPLIERKFTKKQIIQDIPKELLDMSWSCRSPENSKPYNVCATCNEIRHIKRKLGWKERII